MNSELIIYTTEDGQTQINLKAVDGTVWLIQDEIATLFSKSRSTIAEHLQNIFSDGELEQDSVRRNFRRTAADGKDYDIDHYNLDAILERKAKSTESKLTTKTPLSKKIKV